jgi:hypothetical protein
MAAPVMFSCEQAAQRRQRSVSPASKKGPSYLEELQSVAALLHADGRLSALPQADRQLLIRAFDQLWTRVQAKRRPGAGRTFIAVTFAITRRCTLRI